MNQTKNLLSNKNWTCHAGIVSDDLKWTLKQWQFYEIHINHSKAMHTDHEEESNWLDDTSRGRYNVRVARCSGKQEECGRKKIK